MSEVRGFYESLSGQDRDLFNSMLNDINTSAPVEKLQRLEEFRKQLKSEIDQINSRRQALGNQLSNIDTIIKKVEGYIEDNPSLELTLFLNSLQKIAFDLRTEIETLKPENKLTKKYDVGVRIDSLKQRIRFVESVHLGVLSDG